MVQTLANDRRLNRSKRSTYSEHEWKSNCGPPERSSDDDDKGQCTQPVLSPRPPPYTDVARQFGDLKGIAERCSMAGVSYHLRKTKLAWMSEAGSKKTKQTCMADLM